MAYLFCLHVLGQQMGGMVALVVAVGFWIVGLSFYPLDGNPRGVEHLWVLCANSVVMHVLHSELSAFVVGVRCMYALRQRPGFLTLNPINIVLSLLTSVLLCSCLTVAMGRIPPFVAAYVFVTHYEFEDQFCRENGLQGMLRSTLRVVLSRWLRRSGKSSDGRVLVRLVQNVRPSDPGSSVLAVRPHRMHMRRSRIKRIGRT